MIPFPEKKYSVIYADPPWNYAAGGLPVQNSRLRLGEAKPEIAFLVLGPEELDTRKRGNLPSGHKRQTEARVSVSP